MKQALLPANSTAFEITVAETLDRTDVLDPGVNAIIWENLSQNPVMLPWLIRELGLEPVTEFISSLPDVITEGIQWQRLRGTPEAVRLALEWLGYEATLEQAPIYRRKWHATQLRFPELPQNDRPDLIRLANGTGLSMPARSFLRRGVFSYDAPAGEGEATRLDDSMVERDSGIAIEGATQVWSFGRSAEFVHDLTEAEGLAIGNWIPPVTGSLIWTTANYPWTTASYLWAFSSPEARRGLMAKWFDGRTMHLCLRDAANAVIGYRRARACHAVAPAGDGPYTVAGLDYQLQEGGQNVYIEALTGFGDADDVAAAKVSILVGATPEPGVAEGQLWLEADELSGGHEIATKVIVIPLRATVRDQFKFLLRF